MSYYSQVALCVSEKVEIPEKTRSLMKSIDFRLVGNCEGSRLFILDQIKWYDLYPEIAHLIEWMDTMDQEDDDQYRFFRIGEDNDDTESRGAYYENPFNLGIERKFAYDELFDDPDRSEEMDESTPFGKTDIF